MKQYFLFLLLLTNQLAFAQGSNTNNIRSMSDRADQGAAFTGRPLLFLENKGQIRDQYGCARKDIQFRTGDKNVSVFVGSGQLHYQFNNVAKQHKDDQYSCLPNKNVDTEGYTCTSYRVDVVLKGANMSVQPIAEEKQEYCEHYYTVSLNNKAAKAEAYRKVTYPNIYPDIDWVLYIKDNKLEYDFIIRPGARAEDIQIDYGGATEMACQQNGLRVVTPAGEVAERKLYAYEESSKREITSSFALNDHTVTFKLGAYDGTVVIDPSLVWGTYLGNIGEDESFGIAHDSTGNIYIGGYTSSVSDIATIGDHQTVYGGFQDGFVAKFSGLDGNILWASYYGGSGQDEVLAVAADRVGSCYITGFTQSNNNIATAGSFQSSHIPGNQSFLAKFTSVGDLAWGTYFGGGHYDYGKGVACDTSGNIFITGSTSSDSNIATAGSFQDTIGTTFGNAFLAKFNTNGNILWSTYFGGAGYGDDAFGCACDNNNNVYMVGEARNGGIHVTSGCYQDTSDGPQDAFLAKFDSTGSLKWSTYFGGELGEDAEAVSCDDTGNVFITGSTKSLTHIATLGSYQSNYGGGDYDSYLAKFDSIGQLRWSTYFGGGGLEFGFGLACDHGGNTFLGGYTTSTTGISLPGSYQDNYGGGMWDGFVAKFNGDGSCNWATYYGGESGDAVQGLTCDQENSIYLCGATASAHGIATTGSYQPDLSDSTDAFLVKFSKFPTELESAHVLISNLKLYPSPNDGDFSVKCTFIRPVDNVSISVIDILGRLFYHEILPVSSAPLNKRVSLQNALPGLYILHLTTQYSDQELKFLIE